MTPSSDDSKIRSIAVALACAALALCCAALLAALPAQCQQGAPPGPIQLKPGAQPEAGPTAEERKRTIRAQSIEVVAPVTVRDASGEMILDLVQKDFHVFDNGLEQTVDHFDLGGEGLSVVLVLETSDHVDPMIPAVRKTGIVFTQTVMAQTSEAAVVSYDDSVRVLRGFTTDWDSVQKTVNEVTSGNSGMCLYDALDRAIAMLQQRPTAQRRILLAIGEGQDSGSQKHLAEVLRHAEVANVTIYSIGLSTAMADLRAKPKDTLPIQVGDPGQIHPPSPGQGPAGAGGIDLIPLAIWLLKTGKDAVVPNALAVASRATGGWNVSVKRDGSLQKAMDEIGGELHAQYTLAYRPGGDDPTGYHEITVIVDRPKVSVRTRPGYYIAPTAP